MDGYFDYNATTPVSAVAMEAWREAAAGAWHNASSLYREGARVSQLLEEAQGAVADLVSAEESNRVLFTSGATESNNAVLAHFARTTSGKVVISAVEHPSVTDCARALLGERLEEVPVDSRGVLNLASLEQTVRSSEDVSLVSVMAANNESGVLQPWPEVRELCQRYDVPFHCDAAQWIGKLPAEGLGDCDYLTGSAHKLGGPKGVGFLLLPEDGEGFRSLLGGPQQERRRAGTENYPGVAGMLAAWSALEPRLEDCRARGLEARRWAETVLKEKLPGLRIVGEGAERLWNTSLLITPAHDNRRWLTRLNRRGFAVSTGSACSSGKDNPSRVLLAIGSDFDSMKRTVRISAGWDTTRKEWEGLVEAMVEVSEELSAPAERPGVF